MINTKPKFKPLDEVYITTCCYNGIIEKYLGNGIYKVEYDNDDECCFGHGKFEESDLRLGHEEW